jgi:hypothetical protein
VDEHSEQLLALKGWNESVVQLEQLLVLVQSVHVKPNRNWQVSHNLVVDEKA